MAGKTLAIRFHGRVIEHLGIDMYQSPVAAVAELISNAWDADATKVEVTLPADRRSSSRLTITDDGIGMTFEECQARFLKVGYNRRGSSASQTSPGGRKLMGRKGIGKFAGFGISRIVEVDTISKATGERTHFRLDLSKLLAPTEGDESTDAEYAGSEPLEVDVVSYEGPSKERAHKHGTTLTLRELSLGKKINAEQFRVSMARRFVFLQKAAGFRVLVDTEPLPDVDAGALEFEFPRDLARDERPVGMKVVDGWAVEKVPEGEVRWRIGFYPAPISDEDLAGVAVYSHGKIAQRPFFFNLRGGLGGQQGMHYMSGQLIADYVDEQDRDMISTERQRVNWENSSLRSLEKLGQDRVKLVLRLWQGRRAQAKVDAMESRLAEYSGRLGRLQRHEQLIVKRALKAIARISVLSDDQFSELANAILTAWEGGRLRDLIAELADSDEMDSESLVALLAESQVVTALHAAERVKAQLNLILGLSDRVEQRELENSIRDYIAENPWLIAPSFETFRIERGVTHLLEEASTKAKLTGDAWAGRVDLTLSSGDHLLVIEFMRPGLKADWDHISRFEHYVHILREKIVNTKFQRVTGLMVADSFDAGDGYAERVKLLRSSDMDVRDWRSLLHEAQGQWREYFQILLDRAPDDERMKKLAADARPFIAAKKASAKKAPGKKAPGKKAPGKKAPGKKAPAKKAPAKKAPGKKAPAKKAPGKKAPAKKAP